MWLFVLAGIHFYFANNLSIRVCVVVMCPLHCPEWSVRLDLFIFVWLCVCLDQFTKEKIQTTKPMWRNQSKIKQEIMKNKDIPQSPFELWYLKWILRCIIMSTNEFVKCWLSFGSIAGFWTCTHAAFSNGNDVSPNSSKVFCSINTYHLLHGRTVFVFELIILKLFENMDQKIDKQINEKFKNKVKAQQQIPIENKDRLVDW